MRLKHLLPEIRSLFEEGMTPRQIGDLLDVRVGYVRESLNRIKPGCVIARYNEQLEASRNQKSTEQIAVRILRGEPLKKVALDAGLSYGAVWQIGRRNGMRPLCAVKLDRAKRMANLAALGLPQKKIAAEFGMSQCGVSAAIRRLKRLAEAGC